MANYNTQTRNNANNTNFQETELGRSGIDLSYKTKDTLRLGLKELVGYEYIMPHDKIRLKTTHNLQFAPTVASMLPAMDCRVEHVFVPFRAINQDYEDMSSYVDGNPWSNGTFPKVTLSGLITSFMNAWNNTFSWTPDSGVYPDFKGLVSQDMAGAKLAFDTLFRGDFISDFRAQMDATFNFLSTIPNAAEFYGRYLYELLRPWFGQGSILDRLNAPILYRESFVRDYMAAYTKDEPLSTHVGDVLLSYAEAALPISEMALRAIYAAWFETDRDANLEPATALPRYKKLTNANMDVQQLLILCLTPHASVYDRDIYVSANVDSPYRHVVAPILNTSRQIPVETGRNNDVQFVRKSLSLVGNSMQYFDAIAKNNPLPASFTNQQGFVLDLVALKRAKAAKAWLTRGKIHGDEYQDYLLAQYGVALSDNRINKPYRIGGSSTEVNIDTTTNPTSTSEMPAGSKNCNMSCSGGTDSVDFFSEEAGIVLTFCELVPAVTYEPYDIRHEMSKPTDIPQPVLANDSEEMSTTKELTRNSFGLFSLDDAFGRHMYAHAWRGRVSENHSDFLDELKYMTFLRRFQDSVRLNPYFIHVHVNTDFMVDTLPLSTFAFGTFSHDNFVERELPIVTDVC